MVRYFPEDLIELEAEAEKLENTLGDLQSRSRIEKLVLKKRIAELHAKLQALKAKMRVAEDDVKSNPAAYQVYADRKDYLRKVHAKEKSSGMNPGAGDESEP